MKREWIDYCLRLSRKSSKMYSGCRKIHRGMMLTFEEFDDTLTLTDCGFTKAKMRYLERMYLHEESRAVAVALWDRRREQAKYGSVGFTCYNHFIKNDPNKKSKRASVMGPCIQSVTLTWLDKKRVSVDCFYRTTELLKKFPADLVFLRELLEPFNLDGMRIVEVNCHFANITIHPMYFVTIIPHLEDPIKVLESIKKADKYFFDWVVKWTARYVCDEYHGGIAKFAQALRVRKDALSRIESDDLKRLQRYLRDNHPGYRGDYNEGEDDDAEV